MRVSDVIGDSKKKAYRDARLVFKSDSFSTEVDCKIERLDSKKILPYEEYEATKAGVRVVKKLVGYNRGEAQYFKAMQNEKGKWVADTDNPIHEEVEKVILDTRTGKVQKKDTLKGLWFVKTAPASIVHEWLVEDVYCIFTEESSDQALKIYEYLKENSLVAVMKFNPNGTAYNAFLVPQAVDSIHFRLLLMTARVKTNKVDVAPCMTILDAKARERERERVNQQGMASALEEV
jgi:hypothetical protein